MDDSARKELRRIQDGFRETISERSALAVLDASRGEITEILAATAAVRSRHFGNRVSLCSILNAKSGACGEDCAFCAQASCHNTETSVFGLQNEDELAAAFMNSSRLPINHFGLVTSGNRLSGRHLDRIEKVISQHERTGTEWCCSLGCLDSRDFQRLKSAGLKRFHHNLETAESFFRRICSTHNYSTRLETVRKAKEMGLEVCCGGIIGMGESLEQRVEFAFTLRNEEVDAIPLNFLVPVEGTRLAALEPMRPWEILKCIAMFRLVNPRTEIKICAGRVLLRDMQSMIFLAGASGMMVGDLLTIAGRGVGADLQMLRDLEMDYED